MLLNDEPKINILDQIPPARNSQFARLIKIIVVNGIIINGKIINDILIEVEGI